MKEYGGWQFPDHEQHLQQWMSKTNDLAHGRQRYQGTKQIEALKWVRDRRVAIDCGSHIGTWAFYLAKEFAHVHCFEPVAEHRECFIRNVVAENVTLHDVALGERDAKVSIHTSEGSSGDSWISGDGEIPVKRLDDFCLDDVDFLKIDCEGSELFVLRGARETILRSKPCIVVEQKPGHAQRFGLGETEAVDYLRALGARLRRVMSGDFIFSFD
jgi:FkbM family methyltransferase